MPQHVSRSNTPAEGRNSRRKAYKPNPKTASPRPRSSSRWWEQLWGNWFRINLQAGQSIVDWRIVGAACSLTAIALWLVVAGLSAGVPERQPRIEFTLSLPNPVADVGQEERVASLTDSPASATDLMPLEELCWFALRELRDQEATVPVSVARND